MKLDSKRRPIRVLVVDDSAVTCVALTRLIQSDPQLQVVGTATDGSEGVDKVIALQPDLVTLAVAMPRMNGLEALKHIMREAPRPVLMISGLTREGAEITLDALDCGAFDYIAKPAAASTPADLAQLREEIIAKIKAAVANYRRPQSSDISPAQVLSSTSEGTLPERLRIVAIGASTGGPPALQQLLAALPANLPVPILVVQHMPAGFTGPFAQRLNELCRLSIREAQSDELVRSGHVYIGPAGVHLTVQRNSTGHPMIRLCREPRSLHIPSVDVMMTSVAETFGAAAMGVVLTGMGNDGVLGMKAIFQVGGRTVGQDEATCAVYGMPKACAHLGVLQRIAGLELISEQILRATGYYGRPPLAAAQTSAR